MKIYFLLHIHMWERDKIILALAWLVFLLLVSSGNNSVWEMYIFLVRRVDTFNGLKFGQWS